MKTDQGMKIEFPYSTAMYVPPALINKFHDLMRGVVCVSEQYDPRLEGDTKYGMNKALLVEARAPSISFCDELDEDRVMSQQEFDEIVEEQEAKEKADAESQTEES